MVDSGSAASAGCDHKMQISERVIALVYHHHQRWVGQGSPQRMAGSAWTVLAPPAPSVHVLEAGWAAVPPGWAGWAG